MKCAVATFVYRQEPTASEQASFERCLAVLGQYPLYIVCPQSLNISFYERLCACRQMEPAIIRLEDTWFASVDTYNKLMLRADFYCRFEQHDYILIYQLDAWVFKDDLKTWCEKNYAYIGAPFFNDRGEMFPFSGNGGFSLRHVPSFIAVLEGTYRPTQWNYAFMVAQIPARNALRCAAKRAIHFLEMAFCRLSTRWYCFLHHEHEDFVFAKAFSLAGEKNIPLPHEAAFFAFERSPRELYAMTGGVLPFGCHAFEKYDPAFWQVWIPTC